MVPTVLALPPHVQRRVVSHSDAEGYAAEVMRALGYRDSVVTTAGADAGIDVRSRHAVAQVKLQHKPVGRPVLQQGDEPDPDPTWTVDLFAQAGPPALVEERIVVVPTPLGARAHDAGTGDLVWAYADLP